MFKAFFDQSIISAPRVQPIDLKGQKVQWITMMNDDQPRYCKDPSNLGLWIMMILPKNDDFSLGHCPPPRRGLRPQTPLNFLFFPNFFEKVCRISVVYGELSL